MRRPFLVPAAVGTIAFALAAAGCGGSSGPKVAQIGTTPTTTESSGNGSGSQSGNAAAYAACMRKNGVPNFPDPDSQGRFQITGGSRNGRSFGLNPDSASFQKARKACQKLAPFGRVSPQQQQQMQQAMLKFSQCMRSHGVPKFPDPDFSGGGVRMTIGKNIGVDPNSPAFKAAQQACQSFLPGGKLGPGPRPAS